MNRLAIPKLLSGGLITTYKCSAMCRHCLYRSSPYWPNDIIEAAMADRLFCDVRQKGCRSVHIGGGEPFLKPGHLFTVLESAQKQAVDIDYIETNASWCTDQESAVSVLGEIRQRNVDTLLISISPFHNESIPFNRIKNLMQACRMAGLSVFPWIADFYQDLDRFDDRITHSLHEFTQVFGPEYSATLFQRYWISPGGRALALYRQQFRLMPIPELLQQFSESCRELQDTSHFHVDLYGNYIPGLCTGLSIQLEDLDAPLEPEKYPIISTLYANGIRGFYEMAVRDYSFSAGEKEYAHKCELCYDIRAFIVDSLKPQTRELNPVSFYASAHHVNDQGT